MKTTIALIAAFIVAANAQAQDSPFPNTTWKIENTSNNELVVLRKAKKLNLPEEKAKFHFIQFDNDRRFETGNDCYGMSGNYDEEAELQITFKEGIAGMAGDCVEPKSLVGTYAYEVVGDRIELRPIKEVTNEEAYERMDVIEADAAAEDTELAAEEAAKAAEEAAREAMGTDKPKARKSKR